MTGWLGGVRRLHLPMADAAGHARPGPVGLGAAAALEADRGARLLCCAGALVGLRVMAHRHRRR